MPLTARPGVFRGQVLNQWRWYVVDPAAGDPDVLRDSWEADYAGTSPPRWRWSIARLVPWTVFIVISLIWILLATAIQHAPVITAIQQSSVTSNRTTLIVAVVIIGIIVSAILGGLTASALRAPIVFPEDQHAEVVPVPGAVEEWATEDIDRADLWALARQFDRVEQLVAYDAEHPDAGPPAPWFAPQFEAFFGELAVSEFAALEEVAARVGFPLPPEVRPRSAVERP